MHLSSVVSMWISSIDVACGGTAASGNSIVVVDSIIVTIFKWPGPRNRKITRTKEQNQMLLMSFLLDSIGIKIHLCEDFQYLALERRETRL